MVRKLIFIAQAFCVIFLVSCASVSQIGGIEDYGAFLSSLKTYSEPAAAYSAPVVRGFQPLIEIPFDYVSAFNGNCTFAVYKGTEVLLDKKGQLFYAPENLAGKHLIADKFIFEKDGRFGVKSILGDVLVGASYREVDIRGNLILATDNFGRADLYRNSKILREKLTKPVKLYSENLLLYDGRLCDLNLMPLTYINYDVVGEPVCGMSMITDGIRFGYVSEDGENLIDPLYRSGGDFNAQGYTYTVDFEGVYRIIDKSGKTIFKEDETLKPVHFDGKYITFLDSQAGMYGVADAGFMLLTEIRFEKLYGWSVYNGYLISNPPAGPQSFYSLTDNCFVSENYTEITPYENHFLVKTTTGSFILYDENLKVIETGDLIAFDGDYLVVEKNEKYHIYKKEQVL